MLNEVITVNDHVRDASTDVTDVVAWEIARLFEDAKEDYGIIRVRQHKRTVFMYGGTCAEIQAQLEKANRRRRLFGPPPWPDPGPPPKRTAPEPPAVSSGLDWGPTDG